MTIKKRKTRKQNPGVSLMRVKPKMNFRSVGLGGVRLDKHKRYWALAATNQPKWRERGKVFVMYVGSGRPATRSQLSHAEGFLLERSDYTIK